MNKACFLALAAALLLAGCANSGTGPVPPKTAGDVDLQRYQGTWYELARLPMFVQRACVQAEAHYSLRADGGLDVRNRCRTAEGEWREVHGQAAPVHPKHTDKLWVRFDTWASSLLPGLTKGDYWVLYLDDDYRTALVGTPDRDYLWLLARTPEVDPATRERLLEEARRRDFKVDKLIWRAADDTIPAR
ncbi:lipocalin family protein [Zestomonas thermotolerans]|jgi:apolipoprotein D and lipocalin family protein|uniref:lipocalin family protein n=1 Tax=Zestomonas thermotolerans TaxID=157784 RepID=UPI00036B7C36|nr:lipocalin family protein [Pseudomonas thermotolerans]MBO2509125.1 lipocalin [Gammaproteobacteria bacterium]